MNDVQMLIEYSKKYFLYSDTKFKIIEANMQTNNIDTPTFY